MLEVSEPERPAQPYGGLTSPALVILLPLEGRAEVKIIGNRDEAPGLKAWLEADPVRRALLALGLLALGLLASGVEPDDDDDGGDE